MEPTMKFITEQQDKSYYKDIVLEWLYADFIVSGQPDKNHFWHNRSTISDAFDACRAVVALNTKGELMGYMIWNLFNQDECGIIEIIEVKKEYRGQGIFKKMILAFCDTQPQLFLLTASVLPQSTGAFCKAGWRLSSIPPDKDNTHIKLLAPTLKAKNELTEDWVIAVCAEDAYKVRGNPAKYKESIQYFPIAFTATDKLAIPIVTSFHPDGYIGIYHNKKLIADGKLKHLFESQHYYQNLLIISKIQPQNPQLFWDNQTAAYKVVAKRPLIEELNGPTLLSSKKLFQPTDPISDLPLMHNSFAFPTQPENPIEKSANEDTELSGGIQFKNYFNHKRHTKSYFLKSRILNHESKEKHSSPLKEGQEVLEDLVESTASLTK